MTNKFSIFLLLIIFELFYFSEGKPCPEEYRPHKTRCDSYFKCVQLPTKKHVWIPEKCDRGLIFETNLKLCVLPGEDWECYLGDDNNINPPQNQSNSQHDHQYQNETINGNNNSIYGGIQLEFSDLIEKPLQQSSSHSIETIKQNHNPHNQHNQHNNQESEIHNKLIEFIDVKQNDPNESNHYIQIHGNKSAENDDESYYESSGDGNNNNNDGFMVDIQQSIELKENSADGSHDLETNHQSSESSNTNNKFDPKLTQHLQRLAQLIDGLKETYQQNPTNLKQNLDLRPDQLNAFLAHYNIKSGFDAIDPTNPDPNPNNYYLMKNGDIESNVMNQVLQKQNNITENMIFKILNNHHNTTRNKSNQNQNYAAMEPSTKVTVKNGYAKGYYLPDSKYSNSQIVVNRPEGSVLFSLNTKPRDDEKLLKDLQHYFGSNINHKNPPTNYYEYDNEPRISEETLKTVLELSKQMVANQNNHQILHNNNAGYYPPPIIQPMYYPVPMLPSYHNYQQQHYNDRDQYSDEQQSASSNKYSNKVNSNKSTAHKSSSNKNVIPRPIHHHHNDNTEHLPTESYSLDSYGNKISQYIDYPPFLTPPINQNNNDYKVNPYVIDMTTEKSDKPQQHVVTISNYYTPNPHLDNTNANSLFNMERYPTVAPFDFSKPYYNNNPQNAHLNSYEQTRQPSPSLNYNYNHAAATILMENQLNSNHNNNLEQQQSAEFEDNQQPQQQQQQQQSPQNYNYHKNSVNEQIMTNLLTPKLDQQLQQSQPQYQKPQQSNTLHGQQLVNLGGNFINYDVYKSQILSTLNNNNQPPEQLLFNNNLEVITCIIGVRQPNDTDCTKYYVCSKADSKILTYSCPPFTAFNANTKICDAQTYSTCNPQAIFSRYTVTENRKIQLEAIKALQDAKRIRNEAVQAQKLANLIRSETQNAYNNYSNNINQGLQDTNALLQYLNAKQPINYNNEQMSASLSRITATTSTTRKPSMISPPKRRKYFCKEGDKVADQTSLFNYYVCYKTSDGIMKGHKMTCSSGLMFCNPMKLCTLPKNCNI